MITLYPTSGLSNRMRVIDSAISFSEKNDVEIKILWVRNSELNCPFTKLFKAIESTGITFYDLPFLPFKYRLLYKEKYFLNKFSKMVLFDKVVFFRECERLIQENYNFENLIKYKKVFLSSWSRFYPNALMYKLFHPIDELKERIEDRTQNFSVNTIGVHIRRNDNRESIFYSPTELFVKLMKEEININNETNFYLASDSVVVKQELIREFKDRIITVCEDTERNSIKGIQAALVDIYSLSRTKKILGSYFSSFSETAAHISGIELKTIKVHPRQPSASLSTI